MFPQSKHQKHNRLVLDLMFESQHIPYAMQNAWISRAQSEPNSNLPRGIQIWLDSLILLQKI
jgi:hypothetical protein